MAEIFRAVNGREARAGVPACVCGHQPETHQHEWGCKLCDDCHWFPAPWWETEANKEAPK